MWSLRSDWDTDRHRIPWVMVLPWRAQPSGQTADARMKNAFSPSEQQRSVDTKIVAAIERLATLFKSGLQDAAKQHKLTPLQAQLLLFVASHDSALCSVTHLAQEFCVTKATVSESIRVLVEKGYLEKRAQAGDARAFTLEATPSAEALLDAFAGFSQALAKPLKALPLEDREGLFVSLLDLLSLYQKQGRIPLRMCYACRHYEAKGKGFYCHLMQRTLEDAALRIDCPEHEAPE